jgi:putative tryptophan/tyrosine transport system substrate-binding protein
MKRRQFITLIGGAAAAWPLAARAQQKEHVRRVGVLMYLAADDAEAQARLAAFAQALKQLGWSDGRNLQIETRWANADDVRRHAAELVALAPDVILAGTGTATVAPLLQATRTVPIVFVTVIDPVGAGFVVSLAKPGGNATGFTIYEYSMSGKWLELLKEIAPRVTRAAVLRHSLLNLNGTACGGTHDRGSSRVSVTSLCRRTSASNYASVSISATS